MLITVSGIGGSGKSTCIKQIAAFFLAHDMRPVSLRFQRLRCFLFFQRSFYCRVFRGKLTGHTLNEMSDKSENKKTNCESYRELKIAHVLVYIIRAIVFRCYYFFFLRHSITVIDRYFYDNLAQFQIKKKSEKFYFLILKMLIPQPDLAIALNVDNEIIKIRRPHRSTQHITLLNENYQNVYQQFSNFCMIYSDDIAVMKKDVAELMQIFYDKSLS